MEGFQVAIEKYKTHYQERLGPVKLNVVKNRDGIEEQDIITSDLLRKDNYPSIWHHKKKTKDVLVMTHGLSDSPYYVSAIARRFYARGLNVIIPLLPAHGLKDPDKAMEDKELDSKWRKEIDNAVDVAFSFGERVSLGGFSTGGALSLNKILRDPDQIKGGLFLFSGALDVGTINELLSRIGFIESIVKMVEGKIKGIGRDPYKYPELPKFGGMELCQIINENDKLIKGKKISQPVFAAHSAQDKTAKIAGILNLLEHHVDLGIGFIVAEDIPHSEMVLEKDVTLDETQKDGPETPPKANPEFEPMMENATRFFAKHVA